MRLWTPIGIGSLVVVVLADRPAVAQCEYETLAVIKVPGCTGGASWSVNARDLNDAGMVVGDFGPCGSIIHRPFLWMPEDDFQPIPIGSGVINSAAEDISENGAFVVGWAQVTWASSSHRAWIWDGKQLTWIAPPDIPEGGTSLGTKGLGVGEDGTVYGEISGPWYVPHPFAWRDGKFLELPEPLASGAGVLRMSNRAGVVTGEYQTPGIPNTDTWAIRWWPDGTVDLLERLPGAIHGRGHEITNLNRVIGISSVPAGDEVWEQSYRGVHWTSAGSPVDLGVLPPYNASVPDGGNDLGQIVGVSYCQYVDGCPSGDPFFCQSGSMYNLEDFKPADTPGVFAIGRDVNNNGVIMVNGSQAGRSVAFLLAPVDPIPADINLDCKVDSTDLLAVIDSWGPASETVLHRTDVDGDGAVGPVDLAGVLGEWTP